MRIDLSFEFHTKFAITVQDIKQVFGVLKIYIFAM